MAYLFAYMSIRDRYICVTGFDLDKCIVIKLLPGLTFPDNLILVLLATGCLNNTQKHEVRDLWLQLIIQISLCIIYSDIVESIRPLEEDH